MWIHSTRTQIQKVILYSKLIWKVRFKDFWYTKINLSQKYTRKVYDWVCSLNYLINCHFWAYSFSIPKSSKLLLPIFFLQTTEKCYKYLKNPQSLIWLKVFQILIKFMFYIKTKILTKNFFLFFTWVDQIVNKIITN